MFSFIHCLIFSLFLTYSITDLPFNCIDGIKEQINGFKDLFHEMIQFANYSTEMFNLRIPCLQLNGLSRISLNILWFKSNCRRFKNFTIITTIRAHPSDMKYVYVESSILGTPPVLFSSAAPGRWLLLISTGRTPITHDMVYLLL